MKAFAKWNHFGDYNRPVETDMGIFFGQNIYTPDHIHNPEEREKKDMQFAGWLYGGIFAQRASNDEMEHFELNFGVIGPDSFAGPTQRFVHKTLNLDLPQGWENQLGNEFHSNFTWFKRQRGDALLFKHTSNFDSYFEYGFTAGTLQRNAIGSIIFRLGYDLQNDFGPGRLEAPACATYRKAKNAKPVYLFARFGGKLVEYNRFLSGLDTEPVVGMMQFGFVTKYDLFEVSYSQTFLTREYKEQDSTDSYFTVNVTYRF
jgi:lipid A 3-O-deacylase